MKRNYLAQALLVASLGAFAATGYAADTATADKSPGSPGKTATQPATGAMQNDSAMQNGATKTDPMNAPMTSADLRAYEQARTVCDSGPAAQRTECWSSLTTKYSGVNAKCQKLTGNALDACIHADKTGK